MQCSLQSGEMLAIHRLWKTSADWIRASFQLKPLALGWMLIHTALGRPIACGLALATGLVSRHRDQRRAFEAASRSAEVNNNGRYYKAANGTATVNHNGFAQLRCLNRPSISVRVIAHPSE